MTDTVRNPNFHPWKYNGCLREMMCTSLPLRPPTQVKQRPTPVVGRKTLISDSGGHLHLHMGVGGGPDLSRGELLVILRPTGRVWYWIRGALLFIGFILGFSNSIWIIYIVRILIFGFRFGLVIELMFKIQDLSWEGGVETINEMSLVYRKLPKDMCQSSSGLISSDWVLIKYPHYSQELHLTFNSNSSFTIPEYPLTPRGGSEALVRETHQTILRHPQQATSDLLMNGSVQQSEDLLKPDRGAIGHVTRENMALR